MAIDRVHPLKLESPTSGGTQTDNFPTSTNKNEDYIDCRGFCFQSTTSDDENYYFSRDASDNIDLYTSNIVRSRVTSGGDFVFSGNNYTFNGAALTLSGSSTFSIETVGPIYLYGGKGVVDNNIYIGDDYIEINSPNGGCLISVKEVLRFVSSLDNAVTYESIVIETTGGTIGGDIRVESARHFTITATDLDANCLGDILLSGTSIKFFGEYSFPTTDGTANQIIETDGSGVLSWTDKPVGYFELDTVSSPDRVVQPTSASYNEDFVFGSPDLDDDDNTTHDGRFLYEKSTYSFRAGKANNTEWDTRGIGSVGFGLNCQATGQYSFAGGNNVDSTNSYGFAWGSSITNAGQYTAVFGTGHGTISGDRGLVVGATHTYAGYNGGMFGWSNEITSDGSYCLATGDHGLLDEDCCLGTGRYYASTKYAAIVHASGTPSSQGYNQTEIVHLVGTTTSTTLTTLYPGNSSSNGMSIPDDQTMYSYTVRIIGVVTGGTGTPVEGNAIDVEIKGTAVRDGYPIVNYAHIPVDIYRHANLTGCTVALDASGTNIFKVTVAGIINTNITWNAYLTLHEIRW